MTTDRFGPQTPQVETLLKRIATLTEDEVAALDAAWHAAPATGWYAAYSAAFDAASHDTRDAAWNAAWHALGVAAWDAAVDAAAALVVRDLITAEQFDALTGPWVSVIGATWDEVGVTDRSNNNDRSPAVSDINDRFTFGVCRTCGVYAAAMNLREIHNDWHDSMGQPVEPPAPPIPKWREVVNENREVALAFIAGDGGARGSVLYHLHRLAIVVREENLAAIVAIAEREVGDGWQADPSGWPTGTANVESLILDMLIAEDGKAFHNWRGLGNGAAAWLRDITEGEVVDE